MFEDFPYVKEMLIDFVDKKSRLVIIKLNSIAV